LPEVARASSPRGRRGLGRPELIRQVPRDGEVDGLGEETGEGPGVELREDEGLDQHIGHQFQPLPAKLQINARKNSVRVQDDLLCEVERLLGVLEGVDAFVRELDVELHE
jgi:hypothetical protein